MNSYLFAAIDIGSNAVRLLVSNVFEDGAQVIYKKQSLIRIPIRLGAEAFLNKEISSEKTDEFMHTMHAFKHLISVYKPIKTRALATSAFREARNGIEIVSRVFEETGIRIEIITGKEEAEVVYANGLRENMDQSKAYLYMDIGGGSTELTLFKDQHTLASKSFNIGTIRLLMNMVSDKDWDEMRDWVRAVGSQVKNEVSVIGSGGNVNKYCKLLMKDYNEPLRSEEIYHLYKRLKGMSTDERIKHLFLSPDRADVIVPAGKIFSNVMKWSGAEVAFVPKIGVSDGLIKMLYLQHKTESLLV